MNRALYGSTGDRAFIKTLFVKVLTSYLAGVWLIVVVGSE